MRKPAALRFLLRTTAISCKPPLTFARLRLHKAPHTGPEAPYRPDSGIVSAV